MNKRFGKLSILAALSLSAVLIATGCGGNKENADNGKKTAEQVAAEFEKESKSIRVFFGDTKGTDNDEVSEAVSKLSKEKIGVEVEMVFFGAGEYAQKMPKLMATNEQMDIGFDSGDAFVSRARDGAYYDLSADLDQYPKLRELFGDEFLGGVTIDGGIYGIPTLKEMAETWVIYIDQETLDRHNIKASSIKTIADAEVILEALKSEGRLGFNIGKAGEHVSFGRNPEYDTITGPFVISNDDSIAPEKKEVVNYYETDDFREYVELLHSWYEKGYISEDVLENGTITYTNKFNTDKSLRGISYISYAPLNEVLTSKGAGKEMTPIPLTPTTISNVSTRGSVYCIYKKSNNVQSSLRFLQLWNTDKEVNTLIKFGIEGKHYNFIEEDGVKKVKKVDGASSMYLNQNWRSGNVLISQLEAGEPADKYEQYKKYNKNARTSVVLGFTPDLSSLDAELAGCNAVVSTKAAALLTGAIDPNDKENGVDAVVKEMKQAGSAKIITEIQKQYLSWIKNK